MSIVINESNISELYNGNDYIHTVYKGSDLIFDNTDILKRYIEGSKNFTIPSGLTKIKSFGFYGYPQVESITIPNTVTSLGGYCFSNMTTLKEVTFEEPCQIASLSNYCFQSCSLLFEIEIPSSVTSIDSTTFELCTNLTTIYIDKPTDSIAGSPWGATNATVVWNSNSNNPDKSSQY